MKFIENRNRTLLDEICSNLDEFNRIYIAVAFVRDSGVNLLIKKIEQRIREDAKIFLLFGNDFGISELEAIRQLLDIGVNIKIYSGPNTFHLKTYIFSNEFETKAIIGSSNISNSGLKEGIEWNISIGSKNENIDSIVNEFERLYNSEYSIPITESNIDDFSKDFTLINISEIEDNIQGVIDDEYINEISDKKNYIQTRSPGKIWTFQLYLSQLQKRERKYGTEFNIIVICEKGSSNEVIFIIPYKYLKEHILPLATLYEGKYYYNISKSYRFNWQHRIGMDGNKFQIK